MKNRYFCHLLALQSISQPLANETDDAILQLLSNWSPKSIMKAQVFQPQEHHFFFNCISTSSHSHLWALPGFYSGIQKGLFQWELEVELHFNLTMSLWIVIGVFRYGWQPAHWMTFQMGGHIVPNPTYCGWLPERRSLWDTPYHVSSVGPQTWWLPEQTKSEEKPETKLLRKLQQFKIKVKKQPVSSAPQGTPQFIM